jgi:formimidoylglutamate deiminase
VAVDEESAGGRIVLRPERVWLGGRFIWDVAVEIDTQTGRIARVGAAAERPAGAVPVERLPRRALLPGFVNAHSHTFQRLIRGRTQWRPGSAPGADFWSWREAMYAAALALSPDAVHDVARFCFLEMLRAGYTSVGEFHYLHNAPDGSPYDEPNELALRVAAAAAEVGIRLRLLNVCYARGGIDRPLEVAQRRFATPDLDAFLARTAALRASLRDEPTAAVGVAPHSVRAVPRGWLRTLHEFAVEQDMPFHIHASEQPAEVEASVAAYGLRPMELLAREDALDARTTLVHATHVTPDEIALLGGAGAVVAACPTTERDLGDGILHAAALIGAGAAIAIGSDSQTVIAPLEEIRLLEYHERLRTLQRIVIATGEPGEPGEPRAADEPGAERRHVAPVLLAAGTRAGARSLRLPAGDLHAGALADLVAVDLDHEALAGADEDDDALAAALALSAPPDVVRDVWVHGRRVVRDRAHPLDQEATRAFRSVAARR